MSKQHKIPLRKDYESDLELLLAGILTYGCGKAVIL
jgi:hypothetical protein